MFRSWKIARLFDIDIYLHWSFFLLLLWVLLTNSMSAEGSLLLLGVVVALFGCVVLHELGHALAARRFGIGTRDITLYPIGGVARLEGMSEKPWEEFWIAVAGPAVNVVIAALLGVVLAVAVNLGTADFVHSFAGQFLVLLLLANVGMVLFNMLPAFPMDGGRVLRAVLASMLGQLSATRIAVKIANVFVVLFAAGGVLGILTGYGSPMLLLIAAFLWFAGQQELFMVRLRERARHAQTEYIPQYEPRSYEAFEQPIYGRKPVTVWVLDNETGRWVKQESRACSF